ncbi:MAG: Holliday junction branch migration protein RuvA [Bacteroidota bacterium]|jgi:Holliday junction DNA helicase RuvA
MIAFLNGKIAEKTPTYLVIECSGVGYQVNISLFTFGQLPGTENIKILTHLIVKEDAHVLYGFINELEKNLFIKLISVNGVGPNTARMILSSLNPEELQNAILSANLLVLKSIKGIGEKTAQRIILDLKDKVGKSDSPQASILSVVAHNKEREEALQALVTLGFAKNLAEKALDKASKSSSEGFLSVEQLIRESLKNL